LAKEGVMKRRVCGREDKRSYKIYSPLHLPTHLLNNGMAWIGKSLTNAIPGDES
jgi:hypothetical protein